MEFRLLGGIEAVADDGQAELGTARQRSVLAALLMDAGRAVAADELVRRVWGEAPPRSAKDTLYSYLSRLRGLLPGTIERRSGGYAVSVAEDSVDAHRFRLLLEQARAASEDHAALAYHREALALWRGEAFAGTDTPWFNAAREALGKERFAAQLDTTDLRLRLGEHAALQAELSAHAGAHPLDERIAAQYMLALYRCGRQAEALAHYRLIRGLLRDELGVDPGGRLQELHTAILGADPALAAPPAPPRRRPPHPQPPAAEAPWSVRNQLPLDVPGFVGRATLVRRLEEALTTEAAPPVVLSGSPGVGKTALAVHLGHRLRWAFPDGQWYVRLLGTRERPRDASEILAALLRAGGEDPASIPDALDDRAAAFRSRVADRRILLVLDDAADAEQIRPLLPGTGRTAVLITSRHDLRGLVASHAARPVPLDVLDPAEAHHLLAGALGEERVRAEPQAADRLAALCARLPLALRIASANLAARPGRSLVGYADELAGDGRLAKLSVAGDSEAAVRTAFDHSHAALPPGAARLFALLGLHPGPDFGAGAAAALLGVPSQDAGELLEQLATAGLLQRTAADRFVFHDLLRLYAAEHATRQADADAAWRRLCDWYLSAADAATAFDYTAMLQLPRERAASGPFADRHAAADWLEAERAGLVAVITRAAGKGPFQVAWYLADQLRMYFYYRQHRADWERAATAGLNAAVEAGDVLAQAAMRLSLGSLAQDTGDSAAALDHFHQARRAYHDIAHAPGEAAVRANLGIQHALRGEVPQALDELHRSIEAYRRLDMPAQLCSVLETAGRLHTYLGQLEQAVAFTTESVGISEHGRLSMAAISRLTARAVALHGLGRLTAALADAEEAVRLCREHRKQHDEAATHEILARIHRDLGRHDLARGHADRALETARTFGYPGKEIDSLLTLGSLDLLADERARADERLTAALVAARRENYRHQEAEAHIGLAHVRLAEADPAGAAGQAALALATATELTLRPAEYRARMVLATTARSDGDPAAAQHQLTRAEHLRTITGYHLPDWEAKNLTDLTAPLACDRGVPGASGPSTCPA
ncbi:BTAD domain-containing putative transcriptional regulator [Streptomyces sp. KLOTTS4A1]|uniref:AfsR/SARP family transcriptional regulator n=1 Tax=Streptomyces sp. KLOTTS4A1 TaxID=3390996 RepID=UPI0039F4D829